MGSVFIAGFGFNNILLLLLLPNRILRSLDKMINDKEMEEILDEMKNEKKEGKNDINSVNNADFVGLKVRSWVTTESDPETSAAPADPSSKERVEGLKREEMRCSQLGYYRGPMLIVMVVEMRKRKMRKRKMRKKKKKERTGRSMEEND